MVEIDPLGLERWLEMEVFSIYGRTRDGQQLIGKAHLSSQLRSR